MANNETRRTDRKQAIVSGFRHTRGAKPAAPPADNSGDNTGPEAA